MEGCEADALVSTGTLSDSAELGVILSGASGVSISAGTLGRMPDWTIVGHSKAARWLGGCRIRDDLRNVWTGADISSWEWMMRGGCSILLGWVASSDISVV